jgi:hypothetical protein
MFGVKSKKLPEYPANHQVGIRVPKGGSDCAKCEYLDQDTMKDCEQEQFIAWNGSSAIPGKIDEYCCDFFEA